MLAAIGIGKLPIDENHAIDKAAPEGRPSPARGWIVALESRADGIWDHVEWTKTGHQLLADKAYRGISPALRVEKSTGKVLAVVRASLVNAPNLTLTSLQTRSPNMNPERLREVLGLPADASDAAVLAAIGKGRADLVTHQAQVAAVATALGFATDAAPGGCIRAIATWQATS